VDHTRSLSLACGAAIALGAVMVRWSVSKVFTLDGWYRSICYKNLSGESDGYLYFKGGLVWGVTYENGDVSGSNIGWYRNFKGRQYEVFCWELYGSRLYEVQNNPREPYSAAPTRLLVQTGWRGVKVLERTGKSETDFMEVFSPRSSSPVENDKLLNLKIYKQTGRLALLAECSKTKKSAQSVAGDMRESLFMNNHIAKRLAKYASSFCMGIVVLCASGCKPTGEEGYVGYEDWQKIQPGMHYKQVVWLLGKPTDSTVGPGTMILYYAQGSKNQVRQKGSIDAYLVCLTNNVVEYTTVRSVL